jgi:hypothetical protein
MKHAIFATCGALVVAGGLTMSAQTPRPPTPTPSQSTPARTDDNKDKTVTVAGCLKAWDATTGGAAAAPPAATATSPVAKFVLTNVEEDSASARSEAKPSTGTMNKQYVLVADSAVNLSAHLNHKVRVTGKVTSTTEHSAAPTTTRPSDPAKPTETPGTGTDRTGMDKSWSTLTVSSLSMVSATCPGATE